MTRPAVTAPVGGEPLPDAVRGQMERSFGTSFSDVRVHQGGHAVALGAQAYTQGNHVTFAAGRFDPSSTTGQALIGHELAHVVQQRAGRVSAGQGKGAAIDPDPALEAEADLAGARAAAGQPAGLAGAGASGASIDGAAAPIQRKAMWDDGRAQIVELDMAEVVFQKETTGKARVGYCEPTVNDVRVVAVLSNVESLFAPPQITWTGDETPKTETPKTETPKTETPKTDSNDIPRTETGGGVTAHVDAPGVNIGSYYMEVPNRKQYRWTKQIPGEVARSIKTFATHQKTFNETVTIEVSDGGGETSAKTELHEKVHREDHKRAFHKLVVPWNDGVDAQVGKTFTGSTRADVETQVYQGTSRKQLAHDFIDATQVSGKAWHDHPDGKEALPNLVEVSPSLIRIQFKDNTPDLDSHVRDHYPELWDEVKHERGPGLERRERLKEEERSHNLEQSRREKEQRDKEPQTRAANEIKKHAESFLTSTAKFGLVTLLKANCGIGVVAAIVTHSSGDDVDPIHPGHAARYALFMLTQIKEELARLLSLDDAKEPSFVEMVKGKIASHRDKLSVQSTTTATCAPAIAEVLGAIAALLPPP